MHKKNRLALCFATLLLLALSESVRATPISLTTGGVTHLEHFNDMANVGTSAVLPNGWVILETGGVANTLYFADNGSLSTPNTYSYGNDDNTERGLGSMNGADFEAMFGAQFQNNTGNTISSLLITYRGEVWRLGTLNLTDRLDFQYSTNATSLTDGTWTDFDSLDFSAQFLAESGVSLGQHSGNSEPFYKDLGDTISGLEILNESKFWVRWTDVDLQGAADDGLAIDQFRITPAIIQLPEPSAFILLAGMAALGAMRRLNRS